MSTKRAGRLLGFVLATVIAVVTATANGGAVFVPDNLVKNGNFEHCTGCTSGGGNVPDKWSVYGDPTGGTVSWTTADSAFAKASVRITDTSAAAVGIESEKVEASPGLTYVLEVWTKAASVTGLTPATIGVQYFDAGGQKIGGALRTFTLRSSWTPQSTRKAAPVGTEWVNVVVFSPTAATSDFLADAASLLIDVPVRP